MAQRMALTEGAFIMSPRVQPIFFVSQAKKARTIPFGSGDRESDFGEAVIGWPFQASRRASPLPAVSVDPLSYQNRSALVQSASDRS